MTEENNKKHKVFVYGTLRPRDGSGKYVDATHVLYDYAMFNYIGKFPYIESAANSVYQSTVVGNIIEVDDKHLDQLDRYEGVPNGLYNREEVRVMPIGSSEQVAAWAYTAGDINLRVPSGDWADV